MWLFFEAKRGPRATNFVKPLINEFKFDSIAVIICVRSGDRRVIANYMGQCYALNPSFKKHELIEVMAEL